VELGKAVLVAAAAGLLSYKVTATIMVGGQRIADFEALGLATITWAGAVAAGLWLTGSRLPTELRRHQGTRYPRVAEKQAEELSHGIEP
jgi:hypothetical protein